MAEKVTARPASGFHPEVEGMLFRLRQCGENDAADVIVLLHATLIDCLPLFQYVACGEVENKVRALLARLKEPDTNG